MSFQSQLWIMALLLLVAVVYLLWRSHRPVTPTICAVCHGTFNVDSTCKACQQDIHIECWDRHLCKYRIN